MSNFARYLTRFMIAALIVTLAFFVVGLRLDSAKEKASPTPDGTATQEEFERSILKYPYAAPTERVAKIKSGLQHVLLCMSKKEMRLLLGDPDVGSEAYGPKGMNAEWIGSDWTYYLTKRAEGANSNDIVVQVFFDTGDRATWVIPSHIDSARELGRPGGTCA